MAQISKIEYIIQHEYNSIGINLDYQSQRFEVRSPPHILSKEKKKKDWIHNMITTASLSYTISLHNWMRNLKSDWLWACFKV